MTNNEFREWMNGYFSLSDELFLNKKQVHIIQNHGNLVATVEPLEADVSGFLSFLKENIKAHEQVCCAEARDKLTRGCTNL